jgi:hypothetical protein
LIAGVGRFGAVEAVQAVVRRTDAVEDDVDTGNTLGACDRIDTEETVRAAETAHSTTVEHRRVCIARRTVVDATHISRQVQRRQGVPVVVPLTGGTVSIVGTNLTIAPTRQTSWWQNIAGISKGIISQGTRSHTLIVPIPSNSHQIVIGLASLTVRTVGTEQAVRETSYARHRSSVSIVACCAGVCAQSQSTVVVDCIVCRGTGLTAC